MELRKLAISIIVAAGALVMAGCSETVTPMKSSSTETADDDTSGKGLKLGFAQVGAESGWRTANTESIKSEAEKRGAVLITQR